MKTAEELDITEKQRLNLIQLTEWLKSRTENVKFDMKWFATLLRGEKPFGQDSTCSIPDNFNECATSACLCGHGPLAGIEAFPGETWGSYSKRAFGVIVSSDLWDFLFSEDHENDLQAGIRRLEWFLNHGLPEVSDPDELKIWEVPQ